MKTYKKVAVIGGGFSGMVSSILLARAGLDVTLLERQDRLAPLLASYDFDGFPVSHGFHYLGGYYPGGALDQSFERLGIKRRLRAVAIDATAFDVFRGIAKDDVVLPVGLERVQAALERIFPRSRSVLDEYFRTLGRVFRDFSFFTLAEYWFRAGSSLLNVSLDDFLRGRGAEQPLIDFLDGYTEILLGVSAREISLLTHLLGVGAYFLSAHTFEGGGGAIAAALEDEARESGVRTLTGSDVVGIVCDPSRRLRSLRVRSRRDRCEIEIETDACVSTIHPKRLVPLFPDELHSLEQVRRVMHYEDTQAIGLLYIAVERRAAEAYTTNIHLFERRDPGKPEHRLSLLADLGGTTDPRGAEKRFTLIVHAWDNDPRKACPQKTDGRCRASVDLSDADAPAARPAYFDRLLAAMTSRLERTFPDLKGKSRIIGSLSPCGMDRLNATWNGSIYGLKCSLGRQASSAFRPVPGMYLAGQSVVAPGLFGTLVSAHSVCDRILRRMVA